MEENDNEALFPINITRQLSVVGKSFSLLTNVLNMSMQFIIIIIINYNNVFIYCNWVVTRWQWLFYIYTEYEIGYY